MAKVIAFGEYKTIKQQLRFEKRLQKRIEKVEKELGIEEPLLVLTEMNALTIGNHLLDARSEINKALEILGIEEREEIF